jgi:hypothetical protein
MVTSYQPDPKSGRSRDVGIALQASRSAMSGTPYLAVVRRGETRVYQFLKEHFEGHELVHVIWDRRLERRRSTRKRRDPERRKSQRRRPLPDSWDALGFLLVRRGG